MQANDPKARNTSEARKRRAGLLRFGRSEGRLTGMPVLALLYPSQFLAHCGDPALLAAEVAGTATREDVLALAKERIEVGLERLKLATPDDGVVDERWYWAAPLLLDRQLEPEAARAWLAQHDLAGVWSRREPDDDDDEDHAKKLTDEDDDDDGDNKLWAEHVAAAIDLATGKALDLGRMPNDLLDVLAELAVAGPAVAMFRALKRVVGASLEEKLALRNAAAQGAWAFRSLFNQVEVMAMLRSRDDGVPYWQSVLTYCVDGCLQAVMDEYIHVLRDSLGLLSKKAADRVDNVIEEITTALGLRMSRVGVDEVDLGVGGRTVKLSPRNMRTHFALRFTDERTSDESSRGDHVRRAFNSPFWPFDVGVAQPVHVGKALARTVASARASDDEVHLGEVRDGAVVQIDRELKREEVAERRVPAKEGEHRLHRLRRRDLLGSAIAHHVLHELKVIRVLPCGAERR